MCNLYLITTNQAAIRRAVPGNEPVRRQLAADAGRVSGLPRARGPQHRHRPRADHDALAQAAIAAHGRPVGHQHPQHVVAALARLAEAGKSLSCPGEQFRGIRAGAESPTKKKDVVWFALNEDRPPFAFAGTYRC
jgi:hypothetical protein